MVMRKIRALITVFIILAFVLGLVISTVDAKTSAGKSTGKTVSFGVKSVKSKTTSNPAFSVGLNSGKTGTSSAFFGNRLSIPSLGITDVSGFDLQSTAAKQSQLSQQLQSDSSFGDLSIGFPSSSSIRTGPTAIGNALSIPSLGIVYSSGLATDGAGLNVFTQTPLLR
jgi:hypothetical protein